MEEREGVGRGGEGVVGGGVEGLAGRRGGIVVLVVVVVVVVLVGW